MYVESFGVVNINLKLTNCEEVLFFCICTVLLKKQCGYEFSLKRTYSFWSSKNVCFHLVSAEILINAGR